MALQIGILPANPGTSARATKVEGEGTMGTPELERKALADWLGISQRKRRKLDAIIKLLVDEKMASSRKTQMKYAVKGKCEQCGGKKGNETGPNCKACKEKHNLATRKAKQKLVAAGLCVDCREPRDREGRQCTVCYELFKLYKKRRKLNNFRTDHLIK